MPTDLEDPDRTVDRVLRGRHHEQLGRVRRDVDFDPEIAANVRRRPSRRARSGPRSPDRSPIPPVPPMRSAASPSRRCAAASGSMSRPAGDQRQRTGRLVYPTWQFHPTVLTHLPLVLAAAGWDPARAAPDGPSVRGSLGSGLPGARSRWRTTCWPPRPRSPAISTGIARLHQDVGRSGAHGGRHRLRARRLVARSSGTAARSSGLGAPPADGARLGRFPQAPTVRELHRLSEHPEPWFFSSVDDVERLTGGRFDLITPDGACYLAESLGGCLVEKLLRGPTRIVVAERLDELFHTTVRTTAPMTDRRSHRRPALGVRRERRDPPTLRSRAARRWATRRLLESGAAPRLQIRRRRCEDGRSSAADPAPCRSWRAWASTPRSTSTSPPGVGKALCNVHVPLV